MNQKKNNDDGFEMKNFFDLKDEDLIVLNPYNFEEAIKRLENLTLEDVQDDLKYFQKKEFEFRNYEEECVYSIDNVKFATSSINENGENEYYLLNDLSPYLISDEKLNKKNENDKDLNKDFSDKKITLEIKSKEGGKKEIYLKCIVDPKKLSENIINNFIDKSSFEKAKIFKQELIQNISENNNNNFKLTIKIDMSSLNKIYYNKNQGEYFFDFQSPPIYRTNVFASKDDIGQNKDNIIYFKEVNSLFPFRNFKDEISNLKYRHFILMIKKNLNNETTPKEENDINFDTNDELNNSLENLFKNRNGEAEENNI